MLRILHIRELATCKRAKNESGRQLSLQNNAGLITDAAIIIDKGFIVAVGKTTAIEKRFPKKKSDREIDATGKIAIPGFVDCHTHSVFAGSRADEYRSKQLGESYSALHKKGGGIYSTVRATRAASEDELYFSAQKTLREMLSKGTTTVEIKSGYGLTLDDELKILRVIKRLKKTERQDIVSTFLGAHTVPTEYTERRSEYVQLIIETVLPRVAQEALAEYVDVFCDPLGFTAKETATIFTVAKTLGFKVRIHGEQTAHGGGAAVGVKFDTASVDHCDHLSDADIKLMRNAGTTAVLLPGVLLHTMTKDKSKLPAIVNKLRTSGVPIALATDYNPGSSPLISMKLVMDLGMRYFHLSDEACLVSATREPARALGRESLLGSIESGKQADLLLIDAPSVADYLHHIGDHTIEIILKRGIMVKKHPEN